LDGKKELFLKDEERFNDFVLNRISRKEKVLLEDGDEISGQKLIKLLNSLIKFYDSLDRLSRRGYGQRFIEFLASSGVTHNRLFKDKAFMDGFFQRLQEKGFQMSAVQVNEVNGYYEFHVTETQNGGQSFAVNWEFLSSPELKQLMGYSKEYRQLNKSTITIARDDGKKKIDNPQELVNELIDRGKKGLTIQRYKGLGEMNPGQLWMTTMDPEKRTLLKVQIEDALEADDIFTVLMGDKVEPRREFIQSNALEVTELDI
jgi:DNA gyrase subunit B